MNKHSVVVLVTFFTAIAAQAAEPGAAPAKPAQAVTAAASAAPQQAAGAQKTPAPQQAASPQKTAAPQKTAVHSQQDKMRECNKQAAGRKGDERKAFMKTCLSNKKA